MRRKERGKEVKTNVTEVHGHKAIEGGFRPFKFVCPSSTAQVLVNPIPPVLRFRQLQKTCLRFVDDVHDGDDGFEPFDEQVLFFCLDTRA